MRSLMAQMVGDRRRCQRSADDQKRLGWALVYHAKPKVKKDITIRHADLMGVF